jgi:hypothetical protein
MQSPSILHSVLPNINSFQTEIVLQYIMIVESKREMKSSSYRSQKKTAASLSLIEKLDTVLAFLTVCMLTNFICFTFGDNVDFWVGCIAANAVVAVFTSFARPTNRKPRTFFKYIALTALRTITRMASVRQQQ